MKQIMKFQEMNLNIRYDAPQSVWDKIPLIYEKMDGWLDFGVGADKGEYGIPYWFGYNEQEKHISASVESSGLQFSGLMDDEEWSEWVAKIKRIATETLGYKVGEIELGEVDF